MAILAELVDLVIGVDTHKHTHTAAVVVATTGATLHQATVPATPAGYQQLLQLADQQPGQRVWAIESTGGYGAGLTRFLHANAEQVVELDRPKPAATAPSPTRSMPPGQRAKRWVVTSSPSHEPLGNERRCRCGWRHAARRSRPPPTPNGSCTPWWSPPPTCSVAGFAD